MSKPLTQREVADAVSNKSRCKKCNRVVTFNFRMLGLGIVESTWVRTDGNDGYSRDDAYHTFPCVGKKIRLKDILQDYVRLANAEFTPSKEQ